jgi:hypothetical protein
MTSMTSCLLLLVTMLASSSAFNWQQVQNLNQGKMGYYSVGCDVDWDKATRVGGSFAIEPVKCMNVCISSGGDVFSVSVSGCNCFKRDMAKNPMPYTDNVGTATDKQACGCIESASTGK